MKFVKEIIIICIILVIVISLEIITNKILKNSLNWLASNVEYVEENVTKENLEEKIKEIKEKWLKENEKLSLFVEHNELEKVSNSIMQIESDIKNKDNNKTLENIAELKFMIDHIKGKYEISVKNIL